MPIGKALASPVRVDVPIGPLAVEWPSKGGTALRQYHIIKRAEADEVGPRRPRENAGAQTA